jgi:peptide/nickel transport system substrate-binding protein
LIAGVVTLASLYLVTPSVAAATKPQRGGSIVLATGNEIPSLDPAVVGDGGNGFQQASLIYDVLLRGTPDGKWQPELATDIASPDQSLTWNITLRPGLKFSDGSPLDADAVIFNFQRQQAAPASLVYSIAASIASMTAVDATHVQVVLKAPQGSFPISLTAQLGLIANPAQIKAGAGHFPDLPVGAGPFLLTDWVRSSQMTYVRNSSYWQSGKPYLDKITIRPVLEESAIVQALQSGDVDIATVSVLGAEAEKRSGGSVINYARAGSGGLGLIPNHQQAPGNDPAMRKAMAEAFDPAVTNQVRLQGGWNPAKVDCEPFDPNSPYCLHGLWPKYDLAAAKKAVAKYKAAGNSVKFEIWSPPGTYAQDAEYYQQVLNSIGMDTTIKVAVDPATWATELNKGNYALASGGLGRFTGGNPYPSVFRRWSTTGNNLGFPNDPALEADLGKAVTASSDAGQVKAWQDVQRELNGKQHMIWVQPIITGVAARSDVQPGTNVTKGHSLFFYGDEIWVKKKS